MKKIISAALFCTVIAVPAFAEDAVKLHHPAVPDKCKVEHDMHGMHAHGMEGHDMGSPMMGGMGMMGGHMAMEPGMHMLGELNLTAEQRAKITKLTDDFGHDNWALQGQMNDESVNLRKLYEADKRDPAAIGAEYQKVFEVKRQMIVAYLETENRIEEVLTVEQRAKLKAMRSKIQGMYPRH